MTPKGTFAALPVRAQVYIVQLYFDSRGPANFSATPRYWDDANRLNYHHGLKTMSSLSAESYWFSLKRRNPTIDELLEKVFSAGEPLTILQVPYRIVQSFNVEAFSETVKYFLAAQHPVSMRVFTVACFCHLLEWPEALSGLVRPCPKCSDYRLTKDSGQELRFDSRPTAYEAFHFHNTVTGQWLSVGAHMGVPTNEGGYAEPPRHSIRRLRFWMDSALPCAFDGNPTHIGRPMLASVVLDAFGYLTRAELETGMLVCRQWQTVVDRHFKSLPLRHIVKATYLLYADKPILEIRSKSAVADGMDPVIRVAFFGNESASDDATLLLRNAYLEALKIRSVAAEAQSVISELLRKTISCGDLDVGEFSSYDEHIRGHAVDNVAWLVAKTHLRKVTLRIKLASFAQNCLRIFDAVARTRVKYLRVNVYRDFSAEDQLEDSQIEAATFLAIGERWRNFVFTSQCEHAFMYIRIPPAGFPCPFSPNDIVRRFLDMDSVDHFSACALEGRKPEACTTPVAKRQAFASNAFLARFNRLVKRELYDVYYVRNECAGATLSVLVAVTSYAGPIILMKGAVQCGDEVPYPAREYGEDYEDQEEDENDYVGDEEEDDMDEEDDDEGTEEEKDEGTEEEKDEGTEEDDVDETPNA